MLFNHAVNQRCSVIDVSRKFCIMDEIHGSEKRCLVDVLH